MNIRVTWPGGLFGVLIALEVILLLPFVLLGHWGDVWAYSATLAAALSGWWLKGWHDDALSKKASTKGTV